MEKAGPFKQVAPDRLQIHEGGGCILLFGIPFFVAGIFVSLIGLGILPVENADEVPAWAWPLIVLMGLVFVAVGGGLVFGRSWITLDTSRGRVVKQQGLLVPMRQQEYSLHDYHAVAIRFEAGDSDTADRYPVILKANGNSADLTLSSSTQYGEARQGAAFVARFLRLPLVDASTDHESVIVWGQVDETFQERLRSSDDRREDEVRPIIMRSQIHESDSGLHVLIPGPGFRPSALLGFAIPGGILAFVVPNLVQFFRQTETPQFVQAGFISLIVFLFGLLPLLAVIHAVIEAMRSHTLVTAASDGITIEERGAWRTRRTRVPAEEILDLDYGTAQTALQDARRSAERYVAQSGRLASLPKGYDTSSPRWLSLSNKLVKSRGVTLKCRSGLYTFGAGLPDEEVGYLYLAIKRALAGARGTDR